MTSKMAESELVRRRFPVSKELVWGAVARSDGLGRASNRVGVSKAVMSELMQQYDIAIPRHDKGTEIPDASRNDSK